MRKSLFYSEEAMNRCAFVIFFVMGVAAAVLALLISSSDPHHFETNSLLPDIQHISIVDESRTIFSTVPAVATGGPNSLEDEESPSDREALKAMAAALALKSSKKEKALKLMKHAMAMSPRHPKILNIYGEFLEEDSGNIVEADHLYVRAIAFSNVESAEHSRALQNRKRTSLVVEEIDRRTLSRIDEKKKKFQRISARNAALRRAKKEAYFQHIYHSVGIEGNTMSLAQTRSILETRLAVGGKSILEHNEVLGLDAALKYINQTLVDRAVGEITLSDILEIHKRVIGFVDPIEAGMIRRTQVYVGEYAPPHPSHIETLLARFISWLNSPEALDMHPVRLAALAHYKLVYIHPFVDGNGRTSRLLMNLLLMQNGFPPVIIRRQDRLRYYQTLVTANDGDIRPFVRFIAECTERTLDAYAYSTQEVPASSGKRSAVVPFADEYEEQTIKVQEHLDYHDKIIMGGTIGPNVTVTP